MRISDWSSDGSSDLTCWSVLNLRPALLPPAGEGGPEGRMRAPFIQGLIPQPAPSPASGRLCSAFTPAPRYCSPAPPCPPPAGPDDTCPRPPPAAPRAYAWIPRGPLSTPALFCTPPIYPPPRPVYSHPP